MSLRSVLFLIFAVLHMPSTKAFAPTTTGDILARTSAAARPQAKSVAALKAFALQDAGAFVDVVMERSNVAVAEEAVTAVSDVSKLAVLVTEASMGEGPLNAQVQTDFIADVSHITMDFLGFLGHFSSTNKMMNLACTVAGRMLVLITDWIPDHMITPEQLAIQLFFLVLNLRNSGVCRPTQ